MKILVTGAAGFIGFHVSRRLLSAGLEVVGLDNLNDYYDVQLKKDRLKMLEGEKNFSFAACDLVDNLEVAQIFQENLFHSVINLAAQAGVRYSLENPRAYIDSNLVGFLNILEGCRHNRVQHLIYASSSSVYGLNTHMPFSIHDNVDHPVSLYAASKKANELMAHAYSHLYQLPVTGLRFFTVYGPWGRPDMALFLFTRAILAGEPIKVFNYGEMARDFTYIDDIVEGIFRLLSHPPEKNQAWDGAAPDPGSSPAPYRLYNIGNHSPVKLLDFIAMLERSLGLKAKMEMLPMQPGDVPATCAEVADLEAAVGFAPDTPLEQGMQEFVAWYRNYYGVE
ncbi:MAG TPA: NAD-dependent epimerase [Proteobacteria bacterium]|nr:NAD-dependent epimerase [Pseudomonadota bacterium]